jgi:hypothetical protein
VPTNARPCPRGAPDCHRRRCGPASGAEAPQCHRGVRCLRHGRYRLP